MLPVVLKHGPWTLDQLPQRNIRPEPRKGKKNNQKGEKARRPAFNEEFFHLPGSSLLSRKAKRLRGAF
jgi:hypothetical protein